MNAVRCIGAIACAALIALSACDRATAPVPAPDYRPEEAGTVDHALCLLGFEAVPLRELATGHHLVDVNVNGRSAAFILDTGANMSVVHAPLAGALGIDAGRTGARSIAVPGGRVAGQGGVDSLSIGGVPIRQANLVVADLGQLLSTMSSVSGETVHGLIGQDIMKEHRAVIDVARSILYLIEADREPAPVDSGRCTGKP